MFLYLFSPLMKSISPGLTKTEITVASGVDPIQVEEAFKNLPIMETKDISDAVLYALSTRPHVQVCNYAYIKHEFIKMMMF